VDTEDVRLAVYRSFAETGRAPESGLLADGALRELHEQRHVVLDRDGRIAMAHPFAAVPLGFSVMGRETLWWGGCAWDSFALPHLLPDEPVVLVATRCPGCGAALAWVVDRDAPPAGDQVAHFLTPAARMWEDVVHTCGHQRLFCGEELAQSWYAGRLDRGYRRREPAEAKEYFHSVGLRGPFWGL
jgi:hypothetical protein